MAKNKVEEEEDVELEDLEEDEVEDEDDEEEAPKKKGRKGKRKGKKASNGEITFGSTDLAALIARETGKKMDTRSVRVLLRKLAKDGDLDRKVDANNRTRYSWSGENDPEVKSILKAVKSGALEKAKEESLAKVKGKGKKKKKKARQEDDEE